MSKLKNTSLFAGAWTLWYLWTNEIAKEGNVLAENVISTIDDMGENALNILEHSASVIGSNSPLSQLGIDTLMYQIWTSMEGLWNLTYENIGFCIGAGAMLYFVGKHVSKLAWSWVWVESESDDKIISRTAALTPTALLIGGLAPVAWAAATTYVVGRKLWEKILGAKYAKTIGTAAAIGAMGIVNWWDYLTGISMLTWAGTLLWKASDKIQWK